MPLWCAPSHWHEETGQRARHQCGLSSPPLHLHPDQSVGHRAPLGVQLTLGADGQRAAGVAQPLVPVDRAAPVEAQSQRRERGGRSGRGGTSGSGSGRGDCAGDCVMQLERQCGGGLLLGRQEGGACGPQLGADLVQQGGRGGESQSDPAHPELDAATPAHQDLVHPDLVDPARPPGFCLPGSFPPTWILPTRLDVVYPDLRRI